MTVVATALLLLALPFLLWPLLRPPALPAVEEVENGEPPASRDDLLRQVEEVQLDLASGRLDRAEAERRIAELRSSR